jgi:hypothetical protein
VDGSLWWARRQPHTTEFHRDGPPYQVYTVRSGRWALTPHPLDPEGPITELSNAAFVREYDFEGR